MLALWKGLPHGSKSLSGAVKPSGDTQRPGSQNHHTTSPVDSASSHSGSVIVSCATSSSNPALKAPCTSSFAAALKKLAKQAVDPVTTVSSVSSVSTPLPPHQSVTPKHHSLTSGQSSKSAIPSVPVSITPVLNYVNHSVESRNKDAEFSRYSQGGRTSMNLMEPVSLKMDQSSPKTIKSGLYNIKREEMYYENNDTGRRPPSSHQRPEVGRDSEESHASSSGFQLYRNFDRARNSISSYEHAMPYPYQPTFLPPPPSFSHQTYRLEDATYVDHYGMLRNTTTHIPSSSASVLPFVARSPYPPEILGQSIRVASPSGLFTIHERAKYAENRGQELFRHSSRELTSQVIQSPLPVTLSRNSESPGHPGSITYGTPREHSNKHSSPPVAASSTPLNLVRCSNQNTNKWDSHHQIVSQCSQAKSPQEELGFNHSIYLQQELQQPLAMTGRRPVMSELQSIFRDKNYNKNHSISQRRQGPISPTMDVSYSRSSSLPSSSHPIHSERLMLKPTTYSSRLEPLDRLTLLNQERKSVISADNSPHSQAEMCKTGAVPPRVLTPHKSNFSSTLSEPKSTLGEIITNLTVNKAQTMFENHLDTSVLKTEAIGRDLTQQVIPNVQVQKAGCNTQAAITGCTSQWSGLVSKLDLEWEKLQKARLAGKCGDSDDEVESENEENCLKEILIITKGPPLSLDLSPKKLEFLDTVGLTTHQKKQELEFAKYLQGRKVLQERPVFPLDSNNTSRECSPLPLTTNITSEELCFAADFPHKVKFLQFLALKLTTFQEKIEIERKWKVTEEGRVRQKQKLKSKCQKKAKVRDRKPEITSLERLPMRSKKRRLQPSPNQSLKLHLGYITFWEYVTFDIVHGISKCYNEIYVEEFSQNWLLLTRG
ncbi:genetic suppressor element 1-like [Limulus polyphemus]|uniref:Genetic suppressor element 1-like n=1 Tax=Limulus polyphemus TaxID=6850 RepID=A0ABM1SBN9_LIMPO|nr:genetic suppressor element 1-like [Limulus polyphemus]